MQKSSSIRPPRRDSVTISFEAREYLVSHETDPALLPGAANAISRCLGLEEAESVVLVVESGWEAVGAALLSAAEASGIEVIAFIVKAEQARNEPFVARLASRIGEARASVYSGSVAGLPSEFRRRLARAGGPTHRHADMAGVSPAMMVQSMRTDPREIHAVGEALMEMLEEGSELRVSSPLGTELVIRLDPRFTWHNASGLVADGTWAFLPGGEVVTTPLRVDGVLVADGGIWRSEADEHPRSPRIRLRFEDAVLVAAEGLEDEDPLLEELDEAENGRRVGHVSFGTNVGVLAPVNGFQDLRAPGFHLTLGRTLRDLTSADWDSPIEIPLLPRRVDVTLDGQPVLVRGRFVHRLLRSAPSA